MQYYSDFLKAYLFLFFVLEIVICMKIYLFISTNSDHLNEMSLFAAIFILKSLDPGKI